MPDDAGTGDEGPLSSTSKFFRNHAPFTARIKKMMQSDEDVGKVAKASPILISKALDDFLSKLLEGSIAVAQQHNAKILNSSHIKAHVQSDPLLDFCREAVAEVPDLPPVTDEVEAATPRAKKRAKPAAKEEGRTAGPAKPRAPRQKKPASGAGQAAVLAGEAGAPGTTGGGDEAPGLQQAAATGPEQEAASLPAHDGGDTVEQAPLVVGEGTERGSSHPAQGTGADRGPASAAAESLAGPAGTALQDPEPTEDDYDEDDYDEE
ncbi:DNA polymerase epsilon subunit C [Auxenochlorella protothecoides]|uniref:DNA polymerase epsilon subunit C n=2 Tax=Auxenochlorella protothecoides TaxID=3075 RepID=A0A087SLC1_AUXPR|nr:DNA polymerase epsilon subunit C [Auxenochlorella protothecoides]KFM26525.1 DNA polymerase epsilon subunit C [Auxenochlorella protothecoides]RMZ56044.1 hypothetical protein APUTEX25_004468 [Auxenochlorella protothecoides]|eukprot:RMZ56044.1 hypothetical protein APUTEX25_004468 [Auxenochlorella protothecoides]